VLVAHNFSDGYIFVMYSVEGFDASGKSTYGSWGIKSLWKIHKEDGRWDVVDIFEPEYPVRLNRYLAFTLDGEKP